MKPKQSLKDHWRDLCANLGEDDGVSPDELKKQEARQKPERGSDRSTRRLCAHVMRTVHLSLLADCHDDQLHELEVRSVEPYPDTKRLLIKLTTHQSAEDLNATQQKVQAVSHLLRHAVARSMSRKRTPLLFFVVLPNEGTDDEL